MGIKQKVRNFLRPYVTRLDVRLNPKKYRLGDFQCAVCSANINYFLPISDNNIRLWDKHSFRFSIFELETLNILNYKCPKCGASDRDRLYALFLKTKIGKTNSQSFLDIAPCVSLSKLLKSFSNLKYRTADLYMPSVDDKVDITDMKVYSDGQFDMILCSHVLEHVEDDVRAMQELFRVMRPGGFGIFMVPILLSLNEDYQPEGILTEADRWCHFGQGDHVRMYSKKGFVEKLQKVGFRIETFDINYFGSELFERNGISEKSVLYVAVKP